jgi:sulfide:quinone oxidoreductase
MTDPQSQAPAGNSVVIVGGGVAGVEAALALADMAPGRAEITLISPEPEFLYKPLTVEEPFTHQPAARMELEPVLRERGGRFVPGAVRAVDPERHEILLAPSGDTPERTVSYDILVVCVGGRAVSAFARAETFWSSRTDLPIDDLIAAAAAAPGTPLAFVVPLGATWALPLYELALLSRRRAEQLGFADLPMKVYTPEDSPLLLFGTVASDAVSQVLRARRIEVELEASVVEDDEGELIVHPGGARVPPGPVVAMPQIEGPAIAGLPADEHGFIPVDAECRVAGLDDVYAAGDGTTFPVKQGGLATQQADVAAQQVAARVGAEVAPASFRPVLRGQLITGDESLHLKHELTGGAGEGAASLDYLWWPPQKIGGRYLGALLGQELVGDLEPPSRTLEVEVAIPHEWHPDLASWDEEPRPP